MENCFTRTNILHSGNNSWAVSQPYQSAFRLMDPGQVRSVAFTDIGIESLGLGIFTWGVNNMTKEGKI